MVAVVVNDEIYNTINKAAPDGSIDFFHGYTYSGNPTSCAASLATLDIYEKENLFERGANLSEYFLDKIFDLEDVDSVTDIRGYGLFAGVDLGIDDTPGISGTKALKALFTAGLHIKFTGDTALIAPPLIATRSDIDNIVNILREVLTNL